MFKHEALLSFLCLSYTIFIDHYNPNYYNYDFKIEDPRWSKLGFDSVFQIPKLVLHVNGNVMVGLQNPKAL
jgi:hypothetical protein